jgi:hypothetical protein
MLKAIAAGFEELQQTPAWKSFFARNHQAEVPVYLSKLEEPLT